jgi:hypothetical protein
MPSFLDLAFLFKKRDGLPPQTTFKEENRLEHGNLNGQHTIRAFPGQVQHAFNLYSAKTSQISQENPQWRLTQTALYHSFNLRDGQALWFILEDDPSIHYRLGEASGRYPSLQPSKINSPECSLIATFYVHLVAIESCTDDWTMYINDLEEREKAKRVSSTSVPVAIQEPSSPISLKKEISGESNVTDDKSLQSEISNGTRAWPFGPRCPVSRRVGMTLSKFQRSQSGLTSRESLFSPENAFQETGSFAKPLVGKFSLAAYMDLDTLGRELKHAILAVEGNLGVIADIKTQYRHVIGSACYRETMNEGCAKEALDFFFDQLAGIEKGLDAGRHRLMTTRHSLQSEQKLVSLNSCPQ